MSEQEEKKVKKSLSNRSKRLILLGTTILVSFTVGGCLGIKVSVNSSTKNMTSENAGLNEIANILKERWYSEIYYGKDVDEDVLIRQFIGALSTKDTRNLDPYTYLIKNEQDPTEKVKGKLGITLQSYYNYPIIVDVDTRGNSYGKLQVGDIVVAVTNNQTNETFAVANNSDYTSVFTNALGEEGESVSVKAARMIEGTLQYVTENITLGAPLKTLYAYTSNDYSALYPDDNDTLMIKVSSFTDGSDGTFEQFKDIIAENTKKKLIIDLRNNGGGAMGAALSMLDLFLDKDTYITSLLYKDGSKNDFKASSNAKFDFDKIIILQNGGTASASELFISTLTYYLNDKVTLVGEKSYGKGIAQRTYQVLDGQYTLQYTCAKWLRPDQSWLGMTISGNPTEVGFYPEASNMVYQSAVLKAMEANASNIYYKDDSITSYLGFKNDKVYYTNQYFYTVYNAMFNTNIRTDRYFDASCADAIKTYQTSKGLDSNGVVDEMTFINFSRDFYLARQSYNNEYLERAHSCLN